jgi:hypothetical protein
MATSEGRGLPRRSAGRLLRISVTASLLPPECTCDGRSPRCQACIDRALYYLGSTAHVRGEDWARRVAAAGHADKPWPPFEGKAAEIARRLVRDLDRDDEATREALARRCHAGAVREWERMLFGPARPGARGR